MAAVLTDDGKAFLGFEIYIVIKDFFPFFGGGALEIFWRSLFGGGRGEEFGIV